MEMQQNIEECLLRAKKLMGNGLNSEDVRACAVAFLYSLAQNVTQEWEKKLADVQRDADRLYKTHSAKMPYRLFAMVLAMEEAAGAGIESFNGAGDHNERVMARNEGTYKLLNGDDK